MRETDLLGRIYERSAGITARFGQVVTGPGDDCAVVRATPGQEWLLTVDQLVEGRHFLRGAPLERVARKAVARSVSDIAAMGGTTSGGWALATGALPPGFERADALFDGMKRWAEHWGCPLVGGDIAVTGEAGVMVLTVTVGGSPHPVRGPVLRSAAQPGDIVYVTGTLGGSLGSGRHFSFEPRLVEAAWLCDTLGAGGWGLHAMIDISDGLGKDAGRIAAASGVRIEIDAGLLPLSPGMGGDGGWRRAAGDGEDYELLFTAAPQVDVPEVCPQTGTRVTRIGRVVEGEGAVVITPERTWDVTELGWEHEG